MGRNGVVLSFEQRNENGVRYGEAKVDLGGGNVITATYFPPAGFDSWPLPGDVAALENSSGTGAWQATGFLDTKITPLVANSGEVVFYSRSAPGVIAASVLMKADGSVVINGKVTISPDGTIVVNDSVTISSSGSVTANTEVTAMALTPATQVTLSKHVHAGIGSPPTPGV